MLTTVAAGRVFDYSFCLGMYGMSGQGFWTPQDMALGGNGVVYVINRGAEELGQRITRVTLDHQFLGQFGAYGRADGQFVWPRAIALDSEDNVFATDDFLNRVSVFDSDGAFVSSWGEAGSGPGQLNGPAGIAFDADGNVVLVDSMNHRVQRFTRDGEYLGGFGGSGSGDGEFDMPWGVCVDSEGAIYVADWGNHRVQKFDGDGNLLLKFESSISGVGALDRPTSVAVDSEGDVYVTDWGAAPAAGIRLRRALHRVSGGRRTAALAVDADLYRRQPGYCEGTTTGEPGAGVAFPPPRCGEGGRAGPHLRAGVGSTPDAGVREGAGLRGAPAEPVIRPANPGKRKGGATCAAFLLFHMVWRLSRTQDNPGTFAVWRVQLLVSRFR